MNENDIYVVVVQLLSHVWHFATPWTTATHGLEHTHGLPFTISWSLLKLMYIESMMPSYHSMLCCPLLLIHSIFPSIRVFSNESTLSIGGQSIGASASASVLPVNIKGWFPLGLTGLISLLSKGLSRVLSTTVLQQCRILQWKTTTTITHNDRKEFPRHDVEQRNLNKKIYTVWFYLYCRWKISQSKKESFTWTKQDYKLRTAEELMLLNCGVGEDSWEFLRLPGDQTSQS